MHKPQRSRNAALDQTWRDGVGRAPTLMPVSSVSTLRVKLIGANDEAPAALVDGKTRPYPSALVTLDDPADDNEYWHDVTSLLETANEAALPYAHTLPAISLEQLGLEDSGVHELQRPRLWLHPRDSAPRIDLSDGSPTMRVTALERRSPLARVWHAWEQQSPGMTIFTATVLCVMSALAVSLFAY
jgi:hypothetical protein